ncbi:DUF262 domain-containing protein [Weissella cibaria]|uniref:DUF262 domain-containing protein n=1 Tax=Weissella cibaria TaxID=137591 RepID=UPI0011937A8F|nr:DUF262 domain-containing protein [Weissella cibaria]MCS8561316.1 DUF262 domain-containing protein [Weissella cibaria]MCS8566039.1 DUF262 domain-containing protein [Weissella cibaria]MCS8576943.1 DUF262 domain-containing protein [Weissella cibaria]TVV37632.1 DUF262 domain-containing protein [Weissella cibaria]
MAEQFLSAQTVTLKQYLSRDNGQYTIPFSQRPYEWGEAQVNRLFKDLTALGLSENSEDKHVLNFFTFSNEEGSLKLFDGQQRTVTTLMIYAEGLKIAVERKELEPKFASKRYQNYISDEDEDGNVTSKVVFDKKEVTDVFYSLLDLENKDIFEEYESSDSSIQTFIDNKKYIHELWMVFVAEHPGIKVKDVLTSFLDSSYLIQIVATTEEVAQKMFETLNNTGKSLEDYYVLKNDLVSSLGVENVREKWNKLDDLLGEINRTSFLSTFATLTKGKTSKSELIDTLFNPDAEKEVHEQLLQLLLSVADAYSKAVNPNQLDIIDKNDREKYAYLTEMLTDVFSLKQHIQILTAMIAKKYTDEDKIAVLTTIKNLAVKLLFFKEGRANQFESPLAELAHAIYTEELSVNDIQEILSEGPLYVSDDSLRAIIVEREITTPSARKKAKFVFKELYDYEFENSQSETRLPNILQQIHYEHILPEKPKEKSQWLKDFSDDTERRHLTNVLGNATLLIGLKNEKLGNKEFDVKREVYSTSFLPENKKLAVLTKWTPIEIKKRSNDLAERFIQLYK